MLQFSAVGSGTYNGVWGDSQRRHLLNRVMFGFSREDLKSFSGYSLDKMVSALIEKSQAPAPPVNHYQNITADPQLVKLGDTWVNMDYHGTVNYRRQQSLRYWWMQNMWFQKRTIEEKMILFWHNHFVTELDIYVNAQMGYKYLETLRKYALGNFREMVKAVTIDPAMLRYLNGYKSTKKSPDENYARELQELFTLGKGPGSKYTEEDVKQAARILTGHRYTYVNTAYFFQASDHDTSDKTFSSFYGNKVIKGRTGADGQLETNELIDMILDSDEVSRHIVRKLYRFFVYYDITEEIEHDFIQPLAKLFKAGNYEIKPLMTAFFKSEHFYDPGLFGAVIMSPIDFMLKTVKRLEVALPSQKTNLYENYALIEYLKSAGVSTNQHIGDPPGVAGWPAYYQTPLFHQIWINSDTLQKRIAFLRNLLQLKFYMNGIWLQIDVLGFTPKLKNPQDPVALIDELCELLLDIVPSKIIRTKIKTEILLSGQSSDYYWTELWNNYTANPLNASYKSMVLDRLKKMYEYILSLPEYQLS